MRLGYGRSKKHEFVEGSEIKSAHMKLPLRLSLRHLSTLLLLSSVSGHAPASAAVSSKQDHDSLEWSVTLILGQRPSQSVQCISQESLTWTWHLLSESADQLYTGSKA